VSSGFTLPGNAPQAFHVLVKPTGAICNLDCAYCFFLSKEALYPDSRFRMSDDLVETYVHQLLESHRGPEVAVAWQGGEPTLMGLEFFKRAVACVERHKRAGQTIQHTIQTNGTRLDDEWCAFLKANDFLVGLSADGPCEMHDAYRVDKKGGGTFDSVMRAWDLLRKHKVDVNILCAVHAANQDHPLEVYRFFRDALGAEFMQFIPIVERASEPEGHLVTSRSVDPEAYGRFLIAVFDEWVRRDVGRIFVQHFDSSLANWVKAPGAVCVFTETCGRALALEHNGDLYSCDHFVDPAHKLGNIRDHRMIDLVASPQQIKFGRDKRDALPRACRECKVRFACHGECPKNRFVMTTDGEPGLNYLCAAYKAFFSHIDRPMKIMADLLRRRRFADEVMSILAAEESVTVPVKGSGGRDAMTDNNSAL